MSGSKLKTGTTILINSLGCNSTLTKMDISGNYIGDTGAKMLAKALLINTKLKYVGFHSDAAPYAVMCPVTHTVTNPVMCFITHCNPH